MANLKSRIAAAVGEVPGTLLLEAVDLVNVVTCELLEGQSILLYEDTIVAIGSTDEFSSSQASEVVDCTGLVACPSFVDCHLHIESSMLSLENFAKVSVVYGTGGIAIDPHELANVYGRRALEWLRESSTSVSSILNVWLEVPSCVPATPFETSGAVLSADDVEELLSSPDEPDFIGLAEMMNYPGVLAGDNEVLRKISSALAADKIVEGHAPALTGRNLCGYLAAGVESDHEATSGEEAIEKLRQGMKVQIRYGSLAKDLESIVPSLVHQRMDTRHIMVVSDDRHPNELLKSGHLNEALRECVRLGIDPCEALQWVTINPVTHLRLNHKYGTLTPGKKANITLLSSLEEFSVEAVIHRGQIVARGGKLLLSVPRPKPPQEFLRTMKLKRTPKVEEFQIVTDTTSDEIDAHIIGVQEGSLLTKHLVRSVGVSNRRIIRPQLEDDILSISVIERHGHGGSISTGLVTGFGFHNGALASTVAHDSHNVLVVGTDPELMLKAVLELIKLGGGISAVNSDDTISIPLPICGLLSLKNAEEVSSQMDNLLAFVAEEIGTSLINPPMSLSFLALPVIPELKITDKGLFDVTKFEFINVLSS